MKRAHSLLLIIIPLGFSSLGAMLGSRFGHSSAPAPGTAPRQGVVAAQSPSSELAELRREIMSLRRHVVTLEEHNAATAEPAGERATESEPAKQRNPDEVRAEAERARRDAIAKVEAAFRNEAVEPRWAAARVEAVQTMFASDDDLRPRVKAVECRSHTCRVELGNDGSHKLDRALPMFVLRFASELSSVTADHIDDGRGGTTTVLYVTGHNDAVAAR